MISPQVSQPARRLHRFLSPRRLHPFFRINSSIASIFSVSFATNSMHLHVPGFELFQPDGVSDLDAGISRPPKLDRIDVNPVPASKLFGRDAGGVLVADIDDLRLGEAARANEWISLTARFGRESTVILGPVFRAHPERVCIG